MPRFSDTVMDHFSSPRNWGLMEAADRVGVAGTPGQGRFLVLYLRVGEGQVTEAQFRCHGCGASIAAGSMLTTLVSGKSIADCRRLSADDLVKSLDGLPPDKQHCAGFAVRALKDALGDGGAAT